MTIVIASCTYQRPEGLKALLAALDGLSCQTVPASQVVIVIADNSETQSAQAAVAGYAACGRFPVRYVSEPRRGIAHARNAALAMARTLEASHLAFIDDDEVPEPDWLDRLVEAMRSTGAAAAVGPVLPVFEAVPSPSLPVFSYRIERPHKDGLASEGHTCNCLIDLGAIARLGLAFDSRFDATGGEDTDFFDRLRRAGLAIAWAQTAVVHEFVPRARMHRGWLLRRWFRTGTTEAMLKAQQLNPLIGRAVNLGKGSVRILGGAVKVFGAVAFDAWRDPAAVTASCYTLCRGCGFVASSVGYSYEEYTRPSYR